jgi:Mn2+/Fe2+ NRAMP family transporter
MGAAFHMLIPQISTSTFSVVAGAIVLSSLFIFPYEQTANALKWVACVLAVYLFVPFFVKQDWLLVLKSAVTPHLELDPLFIGTVGAFLGTNISAYLFFWESSMEVDYSENKYGRLFANPDTEIPNLKQEVKKMQHDNAFGMGIAVLIMFFVVWTCGTTLYPQGITDIATVEQAATALKPIAGDAAYFLFAIGIMASGFIAVPVLTGTCGYIFAEAFGYPRGMSKKIYEARVFYLVMFLSVVVSLLMDLTGLGAIQALIVSAVVYAITAPPSIWYILKICNNRRIMGRFTNGFWSNLIGYFTFGLMCLAAVCLIWTMFVPR